MANLLVRIGSIKRGSGYGSRASRVSVEGKAGDANAKVDQPIPATLFVFTLLADPKDRPVQSAGRIDLTGTVAPTFKGVNLDRKARSLESLKGKTALLDFWKTRCGPCIRNMPTTEKLYAA